MNVVQRLRSAVAPRTPLAFRRARLMAAITDADRRLAEIADRLDHVRNEYEAQELKSEVGLVRDYRARLQRDLDKLGSESREMSDADVANRERYERFIANEITERRKARMAFIDSLERQGDHRQAKIHRIALLDLESEVRRELPPPTVRG